MTRRAFQPHLYASHAVTTGGTASDSNLLYQWTGTHWSPVDEEEAERDAYAWLVAQDPAWASAENARKAVRAACLFSPRLPKLTQEVVVPTTSGYVHLEGTKLVLKAADPRLGLTHCLDCPYEPSGAVPERFQRFLLRMAADNYLDRSATTIVSG